MFKIDEKVNKGGTALYITWHKRLVLSGAELNLVLLRLIVQDLFYFEILHKIPDTTVKGVKSMSKEQKFYDALKDIFIGARVEGESDISI